MPTEAIGHDAGCLGGDDGAAELAAISDRIGSRFRESRTILTFGEFLGLFKREPIRASRDASYYLKDVFDYYGCTRVRYPWGEFTRFNLFDLPWREPAHGSRPRGALVGHESVQEALYSCVVGFCDEGRPNRLVLMHGPNGSGKSGAVACIMSALENYSTLDEGALYRFDWVFAGQSGPADARDSRGGPTSYAHLRDEELDAKLACDIRDHPLFLIPMKDRRLLLREAFQRAGAGVSPNDWIMNGELSHKSYQIFQALLTAYQGSFDDVLRHVRVERYFISRRYRVGAVTLGPQLSVDAAERPITRGQTLDSVPPSLRALALYETKGELVDAAGGIIEFSDLLKRPLDAFKYLQISIETGEVTLVNQNVPLNCVMVASANELHLDAFREHAEYASFVGRFDPIRVPYLRSFDLERQVYDAQIASQVRGRHVAPHATMVAAQFAVLTRMRKPNPERFPGIESLISRLTSYEKMMLYSLGDPPDKLPIDEQELIRGAIGDLWRESVTYPIYEGRVGASPREMNAVLLKAAQSATFGCLSPIAVLSEIEALCLRKNEFDWMQQDAISGQFHDLAGFRDWLFKWLLSQWREEIAVAGGLLEERWAARLFEDYCEVLRLREETGGRGAGDDIVRQVESMLAIGDAPEGWRAHVVDAAAAWTVDHPGSPLDVESVFARHLRRLRSAMLDDQLQALRRLAHNVTTAEAGRGAGLDPSAPATAQRTIQGMVARFGYCRSCAVDAATALLNAMIANEVNVAGT